MPLNARSFNDKYFEVSENRRRTCIGYRLPPNDNVGREFRCMFWCHPRIFRKYDGVNFVQLHRNTATGNDKKNDLMIMNGAKVTITTSTRTNLGPTKVTA